MPTSGVTIAFFAHLGYLDTASAMAKLDPEQQAVLVAAEPEMFRPARRAWGRRGSALVRLEHLDEATAERALATASANLGRARRR